MGCKSSKPNQRVPPIDPTFPVTGHSDLDDFFQRSSLFLLDIENFRRQTNLKKQHGLLVAGTSNLTEAAYFKTIQVLFWSLSASQQGNIINTGITISPNAPFLHVRNIGKCRETVELTNILQEYLVLILGKQGILEDWNKKLQELKDEQVQMKRLIGPNMSARMIRICDDNMKKLGDEINSSWRAVMQLSTEQKEAMELVDYMEGFIRTSDEVGKRAYDAKLIKPAEIYKWAEEEQLLTENASHIIDVEQYLQKSNKGFIGSGRKLNMNQNVTFGGVSNQFVEGPSFADSSLFVKSRQATMTKEPKEKLLQKHSTGNHSKGKIFVLEKGLEIIIKENTQEEIEKMSPDYLSPGGNKQAGILQGEENILDDEDFMLAPTHESVIIKNFIKE